jgi:head-tail adaptor
MQRRPVLTAFASEVTAVLAFNVNSRSANICAVPTDHFIVIFMFLVVGFGFVLVLV